MPAGRSVVTPHEPRQARSLGQRSRSGPCPGSTGIWGLWCSSSLARPCSSCWLVALRTASTPRSAPSIITQRERLPSRAATARERYLRSERVSSLLMWSVLASIDASVAKSMRCRSRFGSGVVYAAAFITKAPSIDGRHTSPCKPSISTGTGCERSMACWAPGAPGVVPPVTPLRAEARSPRPLGTSTSIFALSLVQRC